MNDSTRFARLAGYHNHRHYLRSEWWSLFRAGVIAKHPECRICKRRAVVVHHLTYERVGRERECDVVALCVPCHERLHVVHQRNNIPYRDFDRAVKLLKGFHPKKPRQQKPATPKPEPILASQPETPLFERREEIKRWLFAGFSAGQIALKQRLVKAEVLAVIAWIRDHDLTPRERDWLASIRKA